MDVNYEMYRVYKNVAYNIEQLYICIAFEKLVLKLTFKEIYALVNLY